MTPSPGAVEMVALEREAALAMGFIDGRKRLNEGVGCVGMREAQVFWDMGSSILVVPGFDGSANSRWSPSTNIADAFALAERVICSVRLGTYRVGSVQEEGFQRWHYAEIEFAPKDADLQSVSAEGSGPAEALTRASLLAAKSLSLGNGDEAGEVSK